VDCFPCFGRRSRLLSDFMSTTLGRKAAVIAVYAEKYVLSLVFLYAAQVEFHKLWVGWSGPPGTGSAVFVGVVRHVIFFLLNLFVGLLLLLGRRAVVPPQKLKDILIPLASSLAPLMYQTIPWFPISLQKSLCPPDLQMPLAAVGLFLGITGPVVAIWSVLYLGRSFGILVVVRKVVLGGPYKWVRHPMYLGYICQLAGLVLAIFSWACFILVPIHVFLLLYRARLEETRLSEYSAEYRESMKRTGFIFPRLRRPAGSSLEAE
jgi:protein-S-isoprenylcysteine O-methyltransferase Ste14